jgi:hypothetical protein
VVSLWDGGGNASGQKQGEVMLIGLIVSQGENKTCLLKFIPGDVKGIIPFIDFAESF